MGRSGDASPAEITVPVDIHHGHLGDTVDRRDAAAAKRRALMGADFRRVVMVGDPVLARPTDAVTNFDASLERLINDMFVTMAKAEGVGLAAPQVGVSLSIFVWDCVDGSGRRQRGEVVNPTIEVSDEKVELDEGCLSVPGPYHPLERASEAVVSGFDRHGSHVVVAGSAYFARCLQHEMDHLAGTLYIDRLPRNRRRKVLREVLPYDWNARSLE